MEFPQFRKYSNNKSYFKISSFLEMEEIQLIGKYYCFNTINSSKMPDRNYILDLIENNNEFYVTINSEEYLLFLNQCKNNYLQLYQSE
jgi:hypothetical protein